MPETGARISSSRVPYPGFETQRFVIYCISTDVILGDFMDVSDTSDKFVFGLRVTLRTTSFIHGMLKVAS